MCANTHKIEVLGGIEVILLGKVWGVWRFFLIFAIEN